MIKTNKDKLPIVSLVGMTEHPKMRQPGYYVGYDGQGRILAGTGGITYNYTIGDVCVGIAGDHIEPGCSTYNPDDRSNAAYNILSCIGNIATVLNGEAKGAKGYVIGTHGGVEHVMIVFEKETLEKLTLDDRFLVKSVGQGLELTDHPDIKVFNIDPSLLEKLEIEENGKELKIKVAKIVPAHLMGSGLGSSTLKSGDYDIMMHDLSEVERLALSDLRFGDLVAIEDHYAFNGPDYLKGACSIGVIVHSDSFSSGHGPGVCVFMSAKENLHPEIAPDANLKKYLHFEK